MCQMVPIATSQHLSAIHSTCRYIASYASSSETLMRQNNAMPDLVSDSDDDTDDSEADNTVRQRYPFATILARASQVVIEYQHRGHHHAHVAVTDMGTMTIATG